MVEGFLFEVSYGAGLLLGNLFARLVAGGLHWRCRAHFIDGKGDTGEKSTDENNDEKDRGPAFPGWCGSGHMRLIL